MRVLTTRLRCGVLYRFRMVKTSFRLPHGCGGISGVSRISRVWGRHSPTRFPQEQNERKANFGTAVESCSVTAADCPCRVFSYIERTRRGLRPAVGGLFSFRQYDAGTGLCCPLAAAFSLSAKDTFQRPPATRWTGIFQNFFRFCNARK